MLKLGLALGGGAARGLAHLGTVRVFLEEGLRPDVIVGTSIGALVGALFATHPDGDAVIARVRDYFECECFRKIQFDFLGTLEGAAEPEGLIETVSRFLKRGLFYNASLTRRAFVSEDVYLENIAELVSDIPIEHTRIRFAAVATDIYRGAEVILSEGSLRRAVAASSAIPGIFPPITIDGRLLADGGWINQLPASSCRALGADYVIAVDVARELEETFRPTSGLEILRRANAVTRHALNQIRRAEADFVVLPEVEDIGWAGFDSVEDCITRGEEAARRNLPRIRDALRERSSLRGRLFRKPD